MGIRFTCEHCSKRLNVKSFLAGKKGLCPECGGRIRIPLEDQPVDQAVSSAVPAESIAQRDSAADRSPLSFDASGPADDAVSSGQVSAAPTATKEHWFVIPPGGGQYGPADRATVEQWIAEGRVSADTLVWREGWPDWEPAARHFVQFQFDTKAALPSPPESAVSVPLPSLDSHSAFEGSGRPEVQTSTRPSDDAPLSYPRAVKPRRSSRQAWIWIGVFAFLAVLLLATLAIVLMLR